MKYDSTKSSRKLYAVASDQSGYFTAHQASVAGYSYRLQNYHREHGNWTSIKHGIYRLRNFPQGPWEDLVQWALWSCDRKGKVRAVISHETAARVHDLADYLPAKVHLTVPLNFHKVKVAGCILHRAVVPKSDTEQHAGFRATSPYRTLKDLMRAGDRDPLKRAIDQATQRGMITLKQRKSLDRF